MTATKDVSHTFYNTLQTLPTILRSLLSGGEQDWEVVCPQSEFQIWSFCVLRKAMPLLAVKPLFICYCHFMYQSYVAVSRPHRTYKLEFNPNRASIETLFCSSSGGYRKPENLFESYEDLLQRKRAQERRYRLVHCTSEVKKLTGSRDLYQKFMNTNQVRRSLYLKLIVLFNNA